MPTERELELQLQLQLQLQLELELQHEHQQQLQGQEQGQRQRQRQERGGAMDMRPFLHRKLTNTELQSLGGRYEGRVLNVEVHTVFNRFKWTTEELVPVITFEDGWSWIPNLGARRSLTEAWGSETDGWVGRRMAIYLHSVVRQDRRTGETVERSEKLVELLDELG